MEKGAFEGEKFLKEKFWRFKDFRDIVQKSAKRKLGKIPPEPTKQIQAYIERLEKILENERGRELILNRLFEKYIIKEEKITPKIVKDLLLGNLAEEMGYQRSALKDERIRKSVLERFKQEYGQDFEEYQPPEETINEQRRLIIENQKETLKAWFDYLTSPEAQNYPSEFRYWIFSQIIGLGSYNEKDKSFYKRSESTIAPFLPINSQALALILDELLRKYQKQPSEILPNLSEEEQKDYQQRLKSENFSKLYGWALDYVKRLKLPEERLPITIGEWREFKDPKEAQNLVSQIKDFSTGWCIATETVAQNYLDNSRILIYFSQDVNGQNTIPRIAIVIDKETGNINEIRGIAEAQNLDPYITEVLEKKLKEIPGGEEYLQTLEDMKKLAEIHFKHLNNQELTKEDLRFIYQIDKKIRGFGYQQDPRIKEILKKRDKRKDLAQIFDCKEDQIALNVLEFDPNKTIVFYGDFIGNLRLDITSLGNLEIIIGNAYFEYSQVRDLGNLRIIGRAGYFSDSYITSLGNLEEIGGIAYFEYSQVTDLGNLRRIGWSVYFSNSQITSLKNLEEIGGYADFENSQVTDLGNLRRIGGLAYVKEEQKKLIEELRKRGFRLNIIE
ncbi:MAG: hypothetical protein C4348_00620 [Patescibacteria group bacterium]